MHATAVGVVEEEDVAVLEPDRRIVGVVLEDVLHRSVVEEGVQDDAGRHPGKVTLRREHADAEVARLQHLRHAQVLADVATVIDDRVELVEEDLEVDLVEPSCPRQLELGRRFEHVAGQHLGIDARALLQQWAGEVGDSRLEIEVGDVDELLDLGH